MMLHVAVPPFPFVTAMLQGGDDSQPQDGQRFLKVIWNVTGRVGRIVTDNPLIRLFQSYRAELQTYLTRRLRDPELAADLTQEAFLRYAEHPPAMAGEIRNNRSYLYRTAHNLAVDHIRKSARDRTDMPGDPVMAALPDDHPGQEIQTADRQNLRQLRAVLDELPDRTRQVFALNRIEGLSYQQVAQRMGISESSVQKHLARALLHATRRLRDKDVIQ